MKNILFTTHLDDNFIDGALVMLYSMKKNVKDFLDYPVKIMHSTVIAGISEDNQRRIKQLVPHVEFEDINKEEYINAPVQYPNHRTAFLSLECFKSTTYDKVFFFDCDMLCVNDITDGIETAPDNMVSGCGGTPNDINCGLFIIGKDWLNDEVYTAMVNSISRYGVTRLFTQHMINGVVPQFNLLPDGYNWKVGPETDLSRITQGYDISEETKIIHWAGALPDKSRQERPPYLKPWQDSEDANPVTKLWYKYKKEMLKELK